MIKKPLLSQECSIKPVSVLLIQCKFSEQDTMASLLWLYSRTSRTSLAL